MTKGPDKVELAGDEPYPPRPAPRRKRRRRRSPADTGLDTLMEAATKAGMSLLRRMREELNRSAGDDGSARSALRDRILSYVALTLGFAAAVMEFGVPGFLAEQQSHLCQRWGFVFMWFIGPPVGLFAALFSLGVRATISPTLDRGSPLIVVQWIAFSLGLISFAFGLFMFVAITSLGPF